MTEVKPIQTVYKGHKFRSRLEARWAVFFDAAKIKYEYENEGFKCSDGTMYLPDFYLPQLDTHVEVKGNRETSWQEIKKAEKMIVWGGPIRRILILSDIPGNCDGGMWHFPCFYWEGENDQVWLGWWFFYDSGDNGEDFVRGHISSADYLPPWSIWGDGDYRAIRDKLSFQAVSDTVLRKEANRFNRGNYIVDEYEDAYVQAQLDFNGMTFRAFDKARQARFEHGENG